MPLRLRAMRLTECAKNGRRVEMVRVADVLGDAKWPPRARVCELGANGGVGAVSARATGVWENHRDV